MTPANMSGFDFVAIIFAVPFGLAIVEIAQGLSIALRQREQVRIGWLTPLCGMFVLLNIAVSLNLFYSRQPYVDANAPTIVVALALSILFYIAASFVFPHAIERGQDLDDWFMKNRKFSLGGTFLLYAVFSFSTPMLRTRESALDQVLAVVVAIGLFSLFAVPLWIAIRTISQRTALRMLVLLNVLWSGLMAVSVVI